MVRPSRRADGNHRDAHRRHLVGRHQALVRRRSLNQHWTLVRHRSLWRQQFMVISGPGQWSLNALVLYIVYISLALVYIALLWSITTSPSLVNNTIASPPLCRVHDASCP